jgi:hypothetical protein
MDADTENLVRCMEPNCQKALSIKWGMAVGFRAYTGEIYCDELCHDMDEKRRWREHRTHDQRARELTFATTRPKPIH